RRPCPGCGRGRRGAQAGADRLRRATGRRGARGATATTPAPVARAKPTATPAARTEGAVRTRSSAPPAGSRDSQQTGEQRRRKRPRVTLDHRSYRLSRSFDRFQPVDLRIDAGKLPGVARAEESPSGDVRHLLERFLVDLV